MTVIRECKAGDMGAVAAIYAEHVLHGTASFETEPPGEAEMAARRARVLDAGLPWLVAELGGEVVGYAYLGPYHHRAAYRWTVEDSIYLAPRAQGQGIGTALLREVIEIAQAKGFRQMMAIIGGGSDNRGSIRLHEKSGFTHVGITRSVGFKLGQWRDVALMQRVLGQGDSTPPV